MTAAMADQVVVRFVDQLELPRAAAQVSHADEPKIAEELQRAIDGQTIDRRQLWFDSRKDVVRREMLAGLQRAENDQPLRGRSLPDPAQPLRQPASAACPWLIEPASGVFDAHSSQS